MFLQRGGLSLTRSLHREAAPVVSGKTDDKTVFRVFKGWQMNLEAQARHNPWSEIDQARRIRDEIILKHNVKPGQLTGFIVGERAQKAMQEFIRRLADRKWDRQMVAAYFGITLTKSSWDQFVGNPL